MSADLWVQQFEWSKSAVQIQSIYCLKNQNHGVFHFSACLCVQMLAQPCFLHSMTVFNHTRPQKSSPSKTSNRNNVTSGQPCDHGPCTERPCPLELPGGHAGVRRALTRGVSSLSGLLCGSAPGGLCSEWTRSQPVQPQPHSPRP